MNHLVETLTLKSIFQIMQQKLMSVLVDLSKLSDAVKNDFVKKTVYRKVVAKLARLF